MLVVWWWSVFITQKICVNSNAGGHSDSKITGGRGLPDRTSKGVSLKPDRMDDRTA